MIGRCQSVTDFALTKALSASASGRLSAVGAICLVLTLGSHQLVENNRLGFLGLVLAQSLLVLAAGFIARGAPDTRRMLAIVLLFAIAPRLFLLFQRPTLSIDVYRYVWDGRVDLAGFNPFLYVPAAPELAFLRDEAIYPWVDKKDYAVTLYPPVAQFIFAVNTLLGGGLIAMKLLLLALEGVATAALISLLHNLKLPRALSVLYLWHPAPLWEVSANGHADAAMIALTLSAFAWGVARKRFYFAGALMALGALVKPTAVLALPAVWRPFDLKLPAFVLGVALLCYAPFLSAGAGILGFAQGYAREQGLDTGAQFFALRLLAGVGRAPGWTVAAYYSAASGAVLGLVARACKSRNPGLETSLRDVTAILVAFLFFLSSDLPWYLLVLLPFAPLTGSWACYLMPTAGFLLYPFGANDLGLTTFMGAAAYNMLAIAGILADVLQWARPRRRKA